MRGSTAGGASNQGTEISGTVSSNTLEGTYSYQSLGQVRQLPFHLTIYAGCNSWSGTYALDPGGPEGTFWGAMRPGSQDYPPQPDRTRAPQPLSAPANAPNAQGTPTPVDFPGYVGFRRGQEGQRLTYACKGGTGYVQGSNLFGVDIYNERSGVCSAAVHAGLITHAGGGTVTIETRCGIGKYEGSTRNGAFSGPYVAPPDEDVAFVFITPNGGTSNAGQPPCSAPGSTPPANPGAQGACNLTGLWNGPQIGNNPNPSGWQFSMIQNGSAVTGTGITDKSWSLSNGNLAANVLTAQWKDSTGSGTVRLTFAPDCNSFDSSWGLGTNSTTWTGKGTRVISQFGGVINPAAAPTAPGVNECSSWAGQGKMPGCIVLHGGFTGNDTGYDIDLFNIACDSTVKHDAGAQQALVEQLKTGKLHLMLQDDTVLLGAQLMLNSGPLGIACGNSAGSSAPPKGTVVNAVDNDPSNSLWNCDNPSSRVSFGALDFDHSRCFTFTYTVPAGGISSAVLHVTLKPGNAGAGQDTDALVAALGSGPCAPSTPVNEVPFGAVNMNVPRMAIQAVQRTVITGDLVFVPVWLIKANNVANLNYQLTYDAKVVKPEGNALKGELLENALFSANPNQSGTVLSGFAQTSGLSGAGSVINIPFRAIGKPGDRTPITVTVTTINDPNGGTLTIDKIPGEIVIYNTDGKLPGGQCGGANTPGGTNNPPSTNNPPGTNTPVSGPGDTGTGTNQPPAPPAILSGDCDGDGALTEVDALCSMEMSVQLRPVKLIMDMDNSKDVTSRDAVIILQRAINK